MWWSLAAGVDKNLTFEGTGSTFRDSGPLRDQSRVQTPSVGSTDGEKCPEMCGIGQEGAKIWWILAAGGNENPTFGGAGLTSRDSGPPRGKTLVQVPSVGPTDGVNGLGTGGIGQEGAESWWILAAGGDENPSFGGAGSTVGDSGPPGGKTLLQASPVGPTHGANGLGTGGIRQEEAEKWGFLAGQGQQKSLFWRYGLNRWGQWPFQGQNASTSSLIRSH